MECALSKAYNIFAWGCSYTECHFYIKRIISLPEGEGRLVSHSVQTPGHGEGTARVTVALGETAQAGAALGAFGQGAGQLDTAEIQPKFIRNVR